jgi:hypothetical protein
MNRNVPICLFSSPGLEVDHLACLVVEGLHRFPAFGAKDGGQVVVVHDRLTGQVDEKWSPIQAAAGFAVAVKTMVAGTLIGRGLQLPHGFAASGTKDGGQVVSVHYRFRGQFKDKGPLVRVDALFAVAIEFGRHVTVPSLPIYRRAGIPGLRWILGSLPSSYRLHVSGALSTSLI